MSHWYFQKDGEEVGPVSANQLVELAGKGALQLDTNVRREDMQHTIAAEKVKELKAAILQYQSETNSSSEKETTTNIPDDDQQDSTGSSSSNTEQGAHTVLTISENLAHRVTDLAGVEKLEGFSAKELFSEVFKKHKSEEVEEYFTVGVPSTTPDITEVDTTWPRPWMFFRMFLFAVLVTVGLYQILTYYGNPIAFPGLLMMGSFVVPIAALIFFVEMNARRNVSLYQVLRLAFSGGVLAMGFTMFMSQALLLFPRGWMIPVIAAPIEETAKLLALVLVIFYTKYRYTLNGLLFGAAIGTGFAAFESAGYAFRELWITEDLNTMLAVILLRGFLAPFGHIVWTGMAGAALWKVKGDRRFSPVMLADLRFLRVIMIAMCLHMAWNLPIRTPFFAYHLVLGAVAWIIVLAFIQDGLKQLRAEKLAALGEGGVDDTCTGTT